MTNEIIDFWSGDFGNKYTLRNRVDWVGRVPFWESIINKTNARSVLEYGCNAGWNLSAIRSVFPDTGLCGVEINVLAAKQARACNIDVHCSLPDSLYSYELVFTAGVLIHVPPQDLTETMENLINVSCDYVLAVEYAADAEEMVVYRGHKNKLWKRNYGKLYEELGLAMVAEGNAGAGFDKCNYWLLKKHDISTL